MWQHWPGGELLRQPPPWASAMVGQVRKASARAESNGFMKHLDWNGRGGRKHRLTIRGSLRGGAGGPKGNAPVARYPVRLAGAQAEAKGLSAFPEVWARAAPALAGAKRPPPGGRAEQLGPVAGRAGRWPRAVCELASPSWLDTIATTTCTNSSTLSEQSWEDEVDFPANWQSYWQLLHSDISSEDEFPSTRPLLAHYTSLANLENILRDDEVWLSNPLDMNDVEEIRFGVNHGMDIVHSHARLREVLGTDLRRQAFYQSLDQAYQEYGRDHVLDLYVMCFSFHDETRDSDGRLSMWRGYGRNGRGAALVLDTSRVPVLEDSPLALAPVKYGTPNERRALIEKKVSEVTDFIKESAVSDEYVHALADALFKRICLFAIFSKHRGFIEEQEWRLVYFKDRDPSKFLEPFMSYFNGPDGIQPKLKLPASPIPGVIHDGFRFADIIHRVIVGPTSSSLLARRSMERMLEKIGKSELKEKLCMSEIPFRG